jgi:hypothetical protein
VFSFPREVTETASTHVTGDRAEQVYRRCDALEQLDGNLGSSCGPKIADNAGQIQKQRS